MNLSPEDLEQLEAYLQGSLSAEQVAALEARLLEEKALRKELLLLSHLEGCLQECFAQQQAKSESGSQLPHETESKSWIRWAAVLLISFLSITLLLYLEELGNEAPQHVQQPSPTPGLELPEAPRAGQIARVLSEAEGTRITPGKRESIPGASRAIFDGDVVEARGDTRSVLQVEQGPMLTLHPGTRIRFDREEERIRVFVETGGIDSLMGEARQEELLYETDFLKLEGEQPELRLLAFQESSWVALSTGSAQVTKLSSGEQAWISGGNYAAVDPTWPFQRMDYAIYCPMWKAKSLQVAGDEYPKPHPSHPQPSSE